MEKQACKGSNPDWNLSADEKSVMVRKSWYVDFCKLDEIVMASLRHYC